MRASFIYSKLKIVWILKFTQEIVPFLILSMLSINAVRQAETQCQFKEQILSYMKIYLEHLCLLFDIISCAI